MAPLSILPGRVRFESPDFLGRIDMCERVESELGQVDGILCVSANHRTGRLLVEFDGARMSASSATSHVDRALKRAASNCRSAEQVRGRAVRHRRSSSEAVQRAFVDVIAQAILPRPMNVLLRAAMSSSKE